MESKKINISKNERRSTRSNEQAVLLAQLSNPQKYSIQSLKIFGYSLLFIRQIAGKSLPILSFNNQFSTINDDGEINIDADISVRS